MFENEYTMDRKLIKEYVLNIMSKRTIIMGMILFILGFSLFCVEQDMIMKYTMLACAFLGIISIFITPLTMINSFEKAAKRLNNGTIEKTKIVFNENIIMDEGKVHLEFEYSQIVKITLTKSFIFLELGDKSGILVLKAGFTKGTEEEFMSFIQEKITQE